MADDDIEIKIGTKADVSGADQAQEALDGVNKATAGNASASAGASEASSDLGSELESLAEKAIAIEEAFQAGDKEAVVELFSEMREEFNKMAESADELNPGLVEFNAALDEIEKKISDDKSFEKLRKQADGASKSLSKIEKLQVAEAIGNVAREARGAGKDIANLSVENDGLVDTALNATTAVGDLVGSVAAGFAAGGPIGAGIAIVTAGLSFFSEEAKKYDEIFQGEAELGFKRSKESIDEATEALKAFTSQQDQIRKNQDLELAKIQDAIDLELVRARNKAELENLDREIAKINILRNKSLSDTQKDEALEKLEIERIKAEAQLEISEVDARVKASEAKVENLLGNLDDVYARIAQLEERKSENDLDEKIANNSAQKENTSKSFFEEFADLGRKESFATSGGILSYDKYEDQIDSAFAAFDEAGDKSIEARTSLAEDLLLIVNQVSDDDLNNRGKAFKDSLEKILKSGNVLSVLESSLDELVKQKQLEEEKSEKLIAKKNAAESSANKAIQDRDKLRDRAPIEREQIENITEKKVTIFNSRNSLKDENKAEKEAQKKEAARRKQTESESTKKSGRGLSTLSGLSEVKDAFKAKVAAAQDSISDGASSAEMQEIIGLINDVLNSTNKRGKVDSNILNLLQSQRAEIQAQRVKQAKLEAVVAKLATQTKRNL